MMKTQKTLTFLILLTVLSFLLSGIAPCQSQLQDEQFTKIYKIDLHTNGSATCSEEYRYFLANGSAILLFLQLWAPPKEETKLKEYEDLTTWLVNRSAIKTSRNMGAANFKIKIDLEYSPPDVYGLVKYQYDWSGFARTEGTLMVIGDALWRRTLSSARDAFIVEYPSGYRVIDISPLPDYDKESEGVLKWYGIRTLEEGGLMVTFEERTFTFLDALRENLSILIGGIIIAGVSFASLWFYRFKKKEELEAIASSALSSLEMKSEEDKVIALLKDAGGSSYQSTITKKYGFSKAKTSMLLASMETRGIIKRKKQGREKIVTLLKEQYQSP